MNNFILKLYRHIVGAIDNPITTSLAFAAATIPIYFYLVNPFLVWLNVDANDYENVQKFIEWFGVPYGLLLALVLVNVWTQYDTTERAFDREADAVFALYNTFLLVSTRQRFSGKTLEQAVAEKVRLYVEHVRAHYTVEYQERRKQVRNDGDTLLNDIRKLVGQLIRKGTSTVITTELLRLINELIDDRGDRLSFSKQRMPKPVLFLAIIASVLWLAPFFVLKFDQFFLGAFFVAGVTFIVVSILLIVYDLDNPFTGTWGLELDAWNELRTRIP